jgi:CubicO group peptidase (beta-lactamase class C family)
MTPQHRTRVGSIDKTYMAVVAVTIFDDLDVPAARWVPQLDERITLRHLLSHRSGLFDYMWDGERMSDLRSAGEWRDRNNHTPEHHDRCIVFD